MARIKLERVEKPLYSTTVSVTIDQINYGNHLGNDRFLSLAHEARMRFLNSINQTEMQFFDNSLIMSDAALMFRSEVTWGEDINIHIAISDVNEYSFDLLYTFVSARDGREVARVKTGMTAFDYQNKKLSKWNDKAQNFLKQNQIAN
ncbi:MAG: hypothetical protein Fur0010_26450 [Bdellovibrio sp.]